MSCEKVALLYSRSRSQWRFRTMFARTISLIGQTKYGDASSSARVPFRNIILLCSRSKPQSFLLDLQKYWNFCNPNYFDGTSSQGRVTHHEKIFLHLHRVWDREYGLGDCGLWTRLLPLLAIPVSKAGVNMVPIKKMWKEQCFVMNILVY